MQYTYCIQNYIYIYIYIFIYIQYILFTELERNDFKTHLERKNCITIEYNNYF